MKIVKKILIALIVGLSFHLFGQGKSDTIFIYKDNKLGSSQSIYFDRTRDNKFYNKINYFNFIQFDKESYRYSINYLNENKLKLTKRKPVLLWKNWVALKQYKNEFYVYHPCDFLFHFRVSINDTTFIDWTGEGPVANMIIEQHKINRNTYELRLRGIYDLDRKLMIHIIDRKRGIAIFEERSNVKDKQYYLMVATNKIKKVPIIVNNCEKEKQSELEFDEPDFVELLKAK